MGPADRAGLVGDRGRCSNSAFHGASEYSGVAVYDTGTLEEEKEMPICKYCGNEAGTTQFCQSCGAQVEAVTPTRMTEEDYRQLENADTVYTEQSSGSETQPQQENKYFRPQTATGLLTANIVVLVLAVLTFCNSLGVTGIAIICSIIGIINAAKVKDCRSDAEVSHRKGAATFMLTLGIISLVIGFVVLIILKIIGSLAHGLYSLIF